MTKHLQFAPEQKWEARLNMLRDAAREVPFPRRVVFMFRNGPGVPVGELNAGDIERATGAMIATLDDTGTVPGKTGDGP